MEIGTRVTFRFEKRPVAEMKRGTVVAIRAPEKNGDPRIGTVVEWDHAPGERREYRMGEIRPLREGEDEILPGKQHVPADHVARIEAFVASLRRPGDPPH